MKNRLIKDQATARVVRPGEPISYRPKVSLGPTGARYNYVNEPAVPVPFTPGHISHSGASTVLRFSAFDLDGVNRTNVFAAMRPGDVITVGTQSATLTAVPSWVQDYINVTVNAFPALVNGEYLVKVARP